MKVPNFARATTILHLSAAQYGQNSAPIYRSSGVLLDVSAVPLTETRPVTPGAFMEALSVASLTPDSWE